MHGHWAPDARRAPSGVRLMPEGRALRSVTQFGGSRMPQAADEPGEAQRWPTAGHRGPLARLPPERAAPTRSGPSGRPPGAGPVHEPTKSTKQSLARRSSPPALPKPPQSSNGPRRLVIFSTVDPRGPRGAGRGSLIALDHLKTTVTLPTSTIDDRPHDATYHDLDDDPRRRWTARASRPSSPTASERRRRRASAVGAGGQALAFVKTTSQRSSPTPPPRRSSSTGGTGPAPRAPRRTWSW